MTCCYFPQYERKENSSNRRKATWRSSFSGSDVRKSGSRSQSHPPSDGSCSSAYPKIILAADLQQSNLRIFSLRELKAATRNFYVGNFLGKGGFGCVYKGWIRMNKSDEEGDVKVEVAVKRLHARGHQGPKEWLSEVKYLGLANHPNLVKLVGYCVEDDNGGLQMLLVYEFMPNKSLEVHLFGRSLPVLTWQSRLQIALGAAQGLAYLHEELEIQIIYRDFKTANILLDNDHKPKLSDFGLARQGPDVGASHVTTAVVGTMGYAAPEYVQTGRLTFKSDVWSFGVVLLELMTGRKALNTNLPKNEQWLLDWVKPHLSDGRKIQKILDPRLSGQYSLEAAEKVTSLASHCLSKSAKSRPKMSDVVEKLKHIIEMPEYQLQAELSETLETETEFSKDQPLNPRRRYLLFKEELNQKMKEDGRLDWRKLSKPTLVKTW